MADTEWNFDKIILNPGTALAELTKLQREQYVPGQRQCDACGFTLYQRSLNASDGTVSARDTQPEPCQNCQTTLRRVTWQERAYQAEDMLADAYDQRNKAIASHTPAVNNFIKCVAEVSTNIGFHAGEPAMEMAGQIISVLAAHPEHTERFLEERGELSSTARSLTKKAPSPIVAKAATSFTQPCCARRKGTCNDRDQGKAALGR